MKGRIAVAWGLLWFAVSTCGQYFRVDPNFAPEFDDWVYALAIQPDGKILVGGGFTNAGGINRRYLARLNDDGTLDTSLLVTDERLYAGSSFHSRVDQIHVADSKLYVRAYNSSGLNRLSAAGEFEQGYGMYAPFTVDYVGRVIYGRMTEYLRWDRVGRFNADGTKDDFLVKVGCCLNEGVNAVGIQNVGGEEKILIGGKFRSINDTNSVVNLARLNEDGSFDTSFFVYASYPIGMTIKVWRDGTFYVAGDNLLAKHLPDGALDPTFEPSYGDAYDVLAGMGIQKDGSVVLVGTAFQNPVGHALLRKFHPDGSRDTNFSHRVNSDLLAVAIDSFDRILIAGTFTEVNCIRRPYLARLIPSDMPDPLPCVPPPPKPEPELSLARLRPAKMVCCWSTNYPEYTLQATRRLRPRNPEKEKWQTVTNTPVIGESTVCVTNRIARWGRYYRLVKE